MKRSLLFGAFDLSFSRSDYARTNTGWLNFQKISHPVFIFNEFATLRLCDFATLSQLRIFDSRSEFDVTESV